MGWDDVRFLEEQWKWDGNKVEPIRGGLAGSRSMGSFRPSPVPRVEGVGPFGTSMWPRKVTLTKSTSLPMLDPEIRATWNDRHHILDTRDNKDSQLLHLISYVQTQDADRIKRMVKRKLVEVPTHQWLEENMKDDE